MRYVSLALVGLVLACSQASQPPAQPQADNPAAVEAMIRGNDSAFAKAAAAKNADQIAAFYADSAVLLGPGAPIANGKAAIRAAWAAFAGLPGFALTFGPDKVDVSGDRAFEVGHYELTANDKSGKPQTTKAKYVTVWGKQADGSWKLLVDAPTTTQ